MQSEDEPGALKNLRGRVLKQNRPIKVRNMIVQKEKNKKSVRRSPPEPYTKVTEKKYCHEWKVISFITLFLSEYLKELRIRSLDQSNNQEIIWKSYQDQEKIRSKLDDLNIQMTPEERNHFSFIISQFGGRLSMNYRREIYNLMILLLKKSELEAYNEICSQEGKKKFPFLTLTHPDQSSQLRPNPGLVSSKIKNMIGRMKDELKKKFTFTSASNQLH